MSETLVCWKCGTALEGLERRFGRTETCAGCGADLHVCRLCEFYEPSVSRQCREPVAEDVRDKTRANFCGYFSARPGAFEGGDSAAARAARAELEALFGVSGGEPPAAPAPQEPERAREQLEDLFGIGAGKGS